MDEHREESTRERFSLPSAGRPCSRRGFLAGALAGFGVIAGTTGCDGLSDSFLEEETAVSDVEVASIADSPAAEDASATLMMVGDILVHRGVWESGEQADGSYNYDHLFAQLADEFGSADISMVNQETILGGTELGLSGYPLFNSPQEMGDAEAAVGVNVVTAATNHALDQGYTGIERELDFWATKHPEVTCLGLATSQEMADAIDYITCNGITFALLNYTESTNGIDLPSDKPYCVSMLESDAVTADVEEARASGADFVVVFPHWGSEYYTAPTAAQQEWAQLFLDLGVDVVIGGHPHVIEPVEVLEREDGHRMLVYWSLGNFVSTQEAKERMVGGMAQVTFEKVAGTCTVTDYSFEPVITHRASGTAFTTYRLSAYTEELASANQIRYFDGCSNFTRAWCVDFCADVLGDVFDTASCCVNGTVEA